MHPGIWTIALQTINFLVLVWLLHRFLYRPVLAVIALRKAEVQRQLDDAKAIAESAKARLATLEGDRAAIAAERDNALKAAAVRAQEAAEARAAQAEREARSLLDATRKSLESERMRALDEAKRVAVDLGAEFARRLLAEVPLPLRTEAWIERIERHLGALAAPDREALAGQLAHAEPLTVVTAAALPPEAADAWRVRLRHLLGDGITVLFARDEGLVAGADLHFPRAILRFSWQSALAELRSEAGIHDDAR